MSIIKIESSPISSGGICSVLTGQPVTFTVFSGLSNGIFVSYEWYLNDVLVSIGTGYTLSSPSEGDNVYVKIINCASSTGLTIGDWVDDIYFYFNDVTTGIPQLYYIDLLSSFDYDILSTVLRSDSTMDDIRIEINGTPIEWTGSATSIDVTQIITETGAIGLNTVLTDSIVTLLTSGTDNNAKVIQGKLRVRRTTGATTTSTTTLPGTTTTTTTSPTTTTTTTAASLCTIPAGTISVI